MGDIFHPEGSIQPFLKLRRGKLLGYSIVLGNQSSGLSNSSIWDEVDGLPEVRVSAEWLILREAAGGAVLCVLDNELVAVRGFSLCGGN